MLNELNLDEIRTAIMSDYAEAEGMRLLEKTQTLLLLSLMQNKSSELISHERARSKIAYQKMGIGQAEQTEMELA